MNHTVIQPQGERGPTLGTQLVILGFPTTRDTMITPKECLEGSLPFLVGNDDRLLRVSGPQALLPLPPSRISAPSLSGPTSLSPPLFPFQGWSPTFPGSTSHWLMRFLVDEKVHSWVEEPMITLGRPPKAPRHNPTIPCFWPISVSA